MISNYSIKVVALMKIAEFVDFAKNEVSLEMTQIKAMCRVM